MQDSQLVTVIIMYNTDVGSEVVTPAELFLSWYKIPNITHEVNCIAYPI